MVLIIGHRGGRNLWPENSLRGFRELAELPVQGVEFDVHLTNAGELLVIHDPTLDRTTAQAGIVADLPAGAHRDIRLKDAGAEYVPALDEVLAIVGATRLELHIELKADASGHPYPGLEKRAVAVVDKLGLAERSILTSFNPDVLRTVRSIAPHIRTLSSFDQKSADRMGLVSGLKTLLEVSDVIAVEKSVLSQHWVQVSSLVPQERLGVWVPNETEDLRYWLAQPIRQLTTDRPDIAVSVGGA